MTWIPKVFNRRLKSILIQFVGSYIATFWKPFIKLVQLSVEGTVGSATQRHHIWCSYLCVRPFGRMGTGRGCAKQYEPFPESYLVVTRFPIEILLSFPKWLYEFHHFSVVDRLQPGFALPSLPEQLGASMQCHCFHRCHQRLWEAWGVAETRSCWVMTVAGEQNYAWDMFLLCVFVLFFHQKHQTITFFGRMINAIGHFFIITWRLHAAHWNDSTWIHWDKTTLATLKSIILLCTFG